MGKKKTTAKGKRVGKRAVKDLSPKRTKDAKGGVDHSEFRIVKLVDASTPKL
jgi:type VI protein secretion system component Hcp